MTPKGNAYVFIESWLYGWQATANRYLKDNWENLGKISVKK